MKKLLLLSLILGCLAPVRASVGWGTTPPSTVYSSQPYSVSAVDWESSCTVVNVNILKNGAGVASQGTGGTRNFYSVSTSWSGSDSHSATSTVLWSVTGNSDTTGSYGPDQPTTVTWLTSVSDPTPVITGITSNPAGPVRPGTVFYPHVTVTTPVGALATLHIYQAPPPFTGVPTPTQYNTIDSSAQAFIPASGASFAGDGNAITAGPDGTTYTFYAAAQTVYNGVSYYSAAFGPYTITVQGVNNSTFVSQSVPAAVYTGSAFGIAQTWNNSGSKTWYSASNYNLGSQNGQDNYTWGTNRYTAAGTVAPGANATLSWTATAPTTAGLYNFQSEMVQDGVQWFGPFSTNAVIGVANRPTGSISATSTSISYLQSTTINASFSSDTADGDSMAGTNIDSPVGTGVGDGSPQASRSYIFTPPAAGTYSFYARMYTALSGGWQTYNQVNVTVTPAFQNFLSFATIGTHTYGDAPFALSATLNSGYAPVFTVFSGPATISGSTLSITGAGTVVVHADQPGNPNYYYPAGTFPQVFTVNAASQAAVTITSPNTITWLSAYTATATGGSSTGALVWSLGSGSTAPSAAINSSTGAVTSTGVGTVVINVYRAADANYSQSATATLTITINRAPTTFTASSFTYDGTSKTVVITPNPAGATVTYGGTLTMTGANSYTATATAFGNYISTNPNVSWTIAKAPQAAVTSTSVIVNYNQVWTPAYNGGSGTGKWQFSISGISNYPTNGAAGTGYPNDSNIITSWVANTIAVSPPLTFWVIKRGDTNYLDSNYSPACTITVNPATDSILFANPGPQTVGTPLTLVATSSSGRTVLFSVTAGTASITGGNTANFTVPGSVTITASLPTSPNYAAVTPMPQTFMVNAAYVEPGLKVFTPTP